MLWSKRLPRMAAGLCAVFVFASAFAQPSVPQELPASIQAAVMSPLRYETERAKDPVRMPGELLQLFQIEPGQTVAEFQAGGGYFVSLLAAAVGTDGHVLAHNNAFLDRLNGGSRPLRKRMSDLNLGMVEFFNSGLDEIALADDTLDAALLIQDYHDTVWLGIDRRRMNEEFFRVLKPGGVLGITDHHAEPGSGTRDVETLHRIDKNVVIDEILAAGFVLEADSNILEKPSDKRTQSIFVKALRGETDQFALRFRKPLSFDGTHANP